MTDSREHLDTVVVKREAERLLSVGASWVTRDSEDRVAFRAEWHDLMDVFGHLVDAYDDGHLAARDADDLRAIATVLLGALPLMERLRLRCPSREALGRIAVARVA